ncbi:hypothetical protein C0993_004758 [Termitomyces sp. T159_Od127]|nr:hypothetical protein C0993_004758 [Termitomyces sp. T159_Od127]
MNSTRHQSARDLADAELQRAIQLSLQEVHLHGHSRPGYVPSQPTNWQYSEPPLVDRSSRPARPSTIEEEEDDPDLRAAIEASLREASAPKPSAPVAVDSPRTEYSGPGYSQSYPPSVPQIPAPSAIPSYDLEPLESDAILTFSQTVNQVEAQGGRDISRYPAVNELYDKANSLRPKLALSLDDAGRKEKMLAEMHDKLSQAVKLYDKILTEQVERPTWRSPPATSFYQPAEPSYSTVNGYSQWASPAPATESAYQTPAEPPRPTLSPQVTHTEYQYAPAQPASASWQPSQNAPQFTPTPAPSAPAFSPPPEPQRRPSYVEPAQQFQSYTTPTAPQIQSLPPVTLPPVTLNSQPYQLQTASPLSFQTSSPPQERVQYAPAPAPQHQQQHQQPPQQEQPHPHAPYLNRHKSVSYAAPSPAGPPPSANGRHPTRSNTVAAPRPPHVPAAPPALQFPVAPTSAPTALPTYGPPAPTGFAPPEERKEALLIDL